MKKCDANNVATRYYLLATLLLIFSESYSQGYNSIWLIGNQWLSSVPKARMIFTDTSYTLNTELRLMAFEGAEATISDKSGNFLMSSNGVWIADATGDTMKISQLCQFIMACIRFSPH